MGQRGDLQNRHKNWKRSQKHLKKQEKRRREFSFRHTYR